MTPGAKPAPSAVGEIERGREHDAEHRSAFVNQRDVHRELAVPREELLGAVERIDQPVAAASVARSVAGGNVDSSATIGIVGSQAVRASTITRSAATSAIVTGLASAFVARPRSCRTSA